MTDGKSILIEIVFDPHSVIDAGTDGHAVSNAIEYSAARRLIERLKAGDERVSLPLTIVVRKKSLLCGFEDILAWPATLVNYRDASLRPSLQKLLGVPLSEDITDERLLAWGIRSISDLPTEGVELHELDEEWLIDCVLEKVTNCKIWARASLLANENWMIDWFDFLLTGNIEHLYSDDYLMRVVRKRIKQWSKAYSDEVPDDLIELLFSCFVLRNAFQRFISARDMASLPAWVFGASRQPAMKLTAAHSEFTHSLAGRAFAGFGTAPHPRTCEALGVQLGQPCSLPRQLTRIVLSRVFPLEPYRMAPNSV